MASLQVSRLWHRKYTRPRHDGKFLPGFFLMTRPDKLSRWVYFPDHSNEAPLRERVAWLTEPSRRAIRDLGVIVVVAALTFWFGR